MLTAILLTVLPTLFMYLLLPKVGIRIKSKYFSIVFAWFSGMYLFTIATFFLTLVYRPFTSFLLLKATYTMLVIIPILLMFWAKDIGNLFLALRKLRPKHLLKYKSSIIIVACFFLFSIVFFTPQLALHDNVILTSPAYWDFHWHAALIQNFVYGDNFPPQNEAFSGIPETYHYFWGIVVAIYEVGGLSLVDALNVVSILIFTGLLLGIIGLSEEFFTSKSIGIIAVLLTLTTSSFHALYYFLSLPSQPILKTITDIFTNTQHPFQASFIQGSPFNYTGTMFNMFYFLEERQLIFGVVYLLLATWIITKREQLSTSVLFWLGCAMGAFFLWHLYMAIMIACALVIVLIAGKQRKKTAVLLLGFGIIFGAIYLYFKDVMQSLWFQPAAKNFPKINLLFTSTSFHHIPFSIPNLLGFYGFSYGIKLLFFFAGSIYLWRKQRNLFITFMAIILPTFLLINTVQLSPEGVTENHKWLRAMNVLIDIISAMILYKIFFIKKKYLLEFIGLFSLFCLTISGVIELMPFLNSQPYVIYASYPSPIITAIWENTSPQATFIGDDIQDIQLAGRKVFLGDVLGGNVGLKMEERQNIIKNINDSKTTSTFCRLTRAYGIDYVEVTQQTKSPLTKKAATYPHFETKNEDNEQVLFIDTKALCKN